MVSENNIAIQAVDRLAHNIVGSLHKLFGFAYSRNTEHYTYQLTLDTAVNFATTTVLTGSIRISQEADFVCTRVNANARALANNTAALIGSRVSASSANPVAGDQSDVPFTLAFTDGSTDRQLQNEAIDAHLVYGYQGGLPGIWAKPRLFARNSNITIVIAILKNAINAADSLRCRVALVGWKIYDAASLDLTSRRP